MRAIYSDNEIAFAEKKRKSMLAGWWGAVALFAVSEASLFAVHLYRVNTMLDRTYQTTLIVISCVLFAIFAFASIAFFGVKYRYTKAYCKMYRDMREGLSDRTTGTVLETDCGYSEKDSIVFKKIVVECPPIRREQRNIRTLLVEENHFADDIKENVKLTFTAHSNILIAYEVHEGSEENK